MYMLVLLICGQAPDHSEVVDRYLRAASEQREQAVEAYEQIIKDNLRHPNRRLPLIAKTIRLANKENKEALKKIKEGSYRARLVAEVGSVGVLEGTGEVRQILDVDSALVEIEFFVGRWSFSSWDPRRVVKESLVLMKGIDFTKFVDNESFASGLILKVTGTYTYENVLGSSRTVYVVEPVAEADRLKITGR